MDSRWGTSRTEAFSDGVFAIAVTLLVLDLAIPRTEFADPWRAIAHEWPSYLAYLTSFVTIGGIWLAHHGVFRRLEYVNSRVMRLNLVLLLGVSFLPFPTRLAAEAIRTTDAERAFVIFYGFCFFLVALSFGALWTAVLRDRGLLRPEVTEEEVQAITVATAPNIGLYVAAIVLAVFLPKVAALGYLVIAVVAVMRARGDQPEHARGVAARRS